MQLYAIVFVKNAGNAFIEVAAHVNILICKLFGRAGKKDVFGATGLLKLMLGEILV